MTDATAKGRESDHNGIEAGAKARIRLPTFLDKACIIWISCRWNSRAQSIGDGITFGHDIFKSGVIF